MSYLPDNYDADKEVAFSELLGKSITKIERSKWDDRLIFHSNEGRYVMMHNQECSESVYIKDIAGELEDLINTPILFAEEVSNTSKTPGDDTQTWTFYKLASIRGYVTICWYGTSEGGYSTSVELLFYPKTQGEQ